MGGEEWRDLVNTSTLAWTYTGDVEGKSNKRIGVIATVNLKRNQKLRQWKWKFSRRRYRWKLKLRGLQTYTGFDSVYWFASLRWPGTPGKRWHRQDFQFIFQETKKKTLDHSLLLNYISTHDGQIGQISLQFEESKNILCIRTAKLHVSHSSQRTENWLRLGNTKIQSTK